MRFFPCLFSSPRAEAVDKLYDQHRGRRAARTISKHPALGAPYGRASAYEGDPYAKLVVTNPTQSHRDNGFDATGFMLGYATGMPISPSHGISTGALLGAAMHQNNQPAASPAYSAPDPAPSPSCDTSSSSSSDSSSSYDSGSSSSSCDSGSSGGGGGD